MPVGESHFHEAIFVLDRALFFVDEGSRQPGFQVGTAAISVFIEGTFLLNISVRSGFVCVSGQS